MCVQVSPTHNLSIAAVLSVVQLVHATIIIFSPCPFSYNVRGPLSLIFPILELLGALANNNNFNEQNSFAS